MRSEAQMSLRSEEQKILDGLLTNYDSRIRPNAKKNGTEEAGSKQFP